MTFHPRRIFCDRAGETLLRKTMYDLLVTVQEVGEPYRRVDRRWAHAREWSMRPVAVMITGEGGYEYKYAAGDKKFADSCTCSVRGPGRCQTMDLLHTRRSTWRRSPPSTR